MDAPKITLYSRILSNIDNSQIEGFSDVRARKGSFNFGKVSGISGGESTNVVEFDIWNNEPAFSAGMLPVVNADAINCEFTAWNDKSTGSASNLISSSTEDGIIYFTKARDITDGDYHKDFSNIGGKGQSLKLGTLFGRSGGDHVTVQTKIVVPANTDVSVKNFVFGFQYDFE